MAGQNDMNAAYITATGPPECIVYGPLPMPQPGPDDVLIRTSAVALNPIDTYIRSGMVAAALSFPFIVGCDVAGIVEQVGANVRDLGVGQRVWATNQGLVGRQGTFAEFCCVPRQWVYEIPPNVGFDQAAACSLVGVTAHLGLFREAHLQQGETMLVQGGAGGVGSMVLQMARLAGARVIATAGSEQNLQFCADMGADLVVSYRNEAVAERVRQSFPAGVDVFFETSRSPDLNQIVSLMNERGRIVLMAGRDARPEFPVGPFYVKQCSLHGFVMFKASPAEMRRSADQINQWMAADQLRSRIGAILPLSQTARAHQMQQEKTIDLAGGVQGKIVLTP